MECDPVGVFACAEARDISNALKGDETIAPFVTHRRLPPGQNLKPASTP